MVACTPRPSGGAPRGMRAASGLGGQAALPAGRRAGGHGLRPPARDGPLGAAHGPNGRWPRVGVGCCRAPEARSVETAARTRRSRASRATCSTTCRAASPSCSTGTRSSVGRAAPGRRRPARVLRCRRPTSAGGVRTRAGTDTYICARARARVCVCNIYACIHRAPCAGCHGRICARRLCSIVIEKQISLADEPAHIKQLLSSSDTLSKASEPHLPAGADVGSAARDAPRSWRRCDSGAPGPGADVEMQALCAGLVPLESSSLKLAQCAAICGKVGPAWVPGLRAHTRACVANTRACVARCASVRGRVQ